MKIKKTTITELREYCKTQLKLALKVESEVADEQTLKLKLDFE